MGRLSKFGGTLSLADDAVVFVPLGGLGRARRFPFAAISAVEPCGVQPSRLRIRLRDNTESVFIVARQRMTSIFDKDVSARDEAVAAIRARTA